MRRAITGTISSMKPGAILTGLPPFATFSYKTSGGGEGSLLQSALGPTPLGASRPCFRGVRSAPALREKPATHRQLPSDPTSRAHLLPHQLPSTSRLNLPPKCSSSCDWLPQKPPANRDHVSRRTKPESRGGGRTSAPRRMCASEGSSARCVAPGARARGRRSSESSPPSA